MDLDKIRELIKIVEDSSFDDFSLTEGDMTISFCKYEKNVVMTEAGQVLAAKAVCDDADNHADEDDRDDGFDYILSPMVGTYYSSPSPDAPAFVRVGDKVGAGDTVCIVEAMKLMNEIECPYEAEIVSIAVSNEQKVEYGQPLFKIKKL